MRVKTLLLALPALLYAQQYELQSHFEGATFLDNFDFYTSWDPTYGYVHYVDRPTAEQHGMISHTPNTTRWGVETTQVLDPSANLGRLSLRLVSKQSWTHGLFVLDLKHMPHNSCGTWPAWWSVGSGVWPDNGEIDIVEFTNNGPSNLMALHTLPGCSIAGSHMTGQLDYNDCNEAYGYTGCAVRSNEIHGSGQQFNVIGGGVYAMEWTSRWIRVWFFPRGYAPESIANPDDSTPPDTSTFGIPVANFEGSCDFDSYFYNHSMIFNVDFCGTYAGNVFGVQGCPMTDPDPWNSCVTYVALNPSAFSEVYWEVNSLRVYQDNSGWLPLSSALSSVVPAASSSSVSKLSSNAQGRPTTPTMSLAGTTPTETAGTFSATSSALSVISSFSTASEASVSSSLSTAVGSIPSSTTPGLPFPSSTSSVNTPSPVVPPPPPPPASTSTPASLPSSDIAPPGVTFVTVVQTITVYPTSPNHQGAGHRPLHRRQDTTVKTNLATSTTPAPVAPAPPSTSIEKNGNCSFVVPQTVSTSANTHFICTFTKLGVRSGEVFTERIIFDTSIPSSTGLTFMTLLTIDTISVQTLTADLFGATFADVTGSFTPTDSSVASTLITAYPSLLDQSSSVVYPTAEWAAPPEFVANRL